MFKVFVCPLCSVGLHTEHLQDTQLGLHDIHAMLSIGTFAGKLRSSNRLAHNVLPIEQELMLESDIWSCLSLSHLFLEASLFICLEIFSPD